MKEKIGAKLTEDDLELQGRTMGRWRVASTSSANQRKGSFRGWQDWPGHRWVVIRRARPRRRHRPPRASGAATSANPCRRHWVRIAARDTRHVRRYLTSVARCAPHPRILFNFSILTLSPPFLPIVFLKYPINNSRKLSADSKHFKEMTGTLLGKKIILNKYFS